MTAVMAIVKGLSPASLSNVALGTTKWIVNDKSSDVRAIVKQIGHVPILAADLDFGLSKHEGLNVFEKGLVKEGVGAGGISVAAFLTSKGQIGAGQMLTAVEENYVRLMNIMGK